MLFTAEPYTILWNISFLAPFLVFLGVNNCDFVWSLFKIIIINSLSTLIRALICLSIYECIKYFIHFFLWNKSLPRDSMSLIWTGCFLKLLSSCNLRYSFTTIIFNLLLSYVLSLCPRKVSCLFFILTSSPFLSFTSFSETHVIQMIWTSQKNFGFFLSPNFHFIICSTFWEISLISKPPTETSLTTIWSLIAKNSFMFDNYF